MAWQDQFDGYCERTDLTYWSEPINAVTNLAFIVIAVFMWRKSRGVPAAQALAAIMFLIGIGSYLFHTHATGWAALSDVAPIGAFILTYLFLTNRNIVGWPLWAASLGTLAYLPFAAGVVAVMNQVPFLAISNFYWSVPILLFLYAFFLQSRHPFTARGFALGALLLCLSITLRSVDEMWCAWNPIGTHFLWHCLNGAMLGMMIEVYRCHVLAARAARR